MDCEWVGAYVKKEPKTIFLENLLKFHLVYQGIEVEKHQDKYH
jgi:hypothetical protein